jgi:hypothetical protein
MRAAYRSEQVERKAVLTNGRTLPSGWREVPAPLSEAEGIDSLVGRSFGLPASRAKRAKALPPRWIAFVVDSAGRVPTCSVRAYDVALPVADLEHAVTSLRYQPAEVGGRRVSQLVLVAVSP